MPEHYQQAWIIPSEYPSKESESVLVAIGVERWRYWWVLCPAGATLYISIVEGGEGSCSENCDFPEIHEEAAELWEEVRHA